VIFLGVVLLLLGLLSIGTPLVTGLAVEFLVGILLIVGGVTRLALAFKAKSWGSGLLVFLLGLVTLACGIMMVTRPMTGLGALTLFLAAYFIAEGFFEIFLAFNWKPLKGWGWTLFSGVLAIFLGVLIWKQWPLSGSWAIGTLIGANLLITGISLLALGSAGRSLSEPARA
jgi:uncharacterized membrane protein HdeD (DUF308 family)